MSVSSDADASYPELVSQSSALRVFRDRWRRGTDAAAVEAAAEATVGDAAQFTAVDPTAVAAKHHAEVRLDPTVRDGVHGLLHVVDGRWVIRIPVALASERRRFAIAHEIGHILLFDAVANRPDLVRELTAPALRPYVERLCNIAAANIVMPAAAIRLELRRWPDLAAAESLPALAERFWVSYEAMARRIAEVDMSWTLLIWEYRTDHRRGPAWRTQRSQGTNHARFVPDGLSSSRLIPDVVTAVANGGPGFAAADRVRFDSPNLRALRDVRAWRSRRRAQPQLDNSSVQPSDNGGNKVFLLGRRL